jgi:tRNA (guanine-N7-)-methyltransferase
LLAESADVYAASNVAEELKIKTHYESLDIAGSRKIHYLKFSLPAIIEDYDEALQKILVEENDTQR